MCCPVTVRCCACRPPGRPGYGRSPPRRRSPSPVRRPARSPPRRRSRSRTPPRVSPLPQCWSASIVEDAAHMHRQSRVKASWSCFPLDQSCNAVHANTHIVNCQRCCRFSFSGHSADTCALILAQSRLFLASGAEFFGHALLPLFRRVLAGAQLPHLPAQAVAGAAAAAIAAAAAVAVAAALGAGAGAPAAAPAAAAAAAVTVAAAEAVHHHAGGVGETSQGSMLWCAWSSGVCCC